MRHKTQQRWALIFDNGYINHGMMSFTRKGVIAMIVAQYRGFLSAPARYGHMTDTQLWRHVKRRRSYTVRRINMRVAR